MAEIEQSRDKTEYLELIKPKKTEYFNVDDQNTNSDILDSKLKEHKERMDSQSERIKDIEMGVRSATVTTRKAVTSFSEDTLSGGSVEIEGIRGLTAVNRGTEYSKNVLLSSWNTVVDDFTVETGDKVFIFATNPVNIKAVQCLYNETEVALTVELDTPYIHTVTSEQTSLLVRCTPSEEGESKLTTFCILLKGELESLTADELAQMVRMSGYWKGIRSVVNPTIVSRGKNLVDKDTLIFDGYRPSENTGELFNEGGDWGHSDFIPIKPSTNYVWSHETRLTWHSEPNEASYIGGTAQAGGISATSPSNAHYIRIGVREANKETFQLEEGSTITDCVDYIQDEQVINGEFHSLPNGVCDDLEYQKTGVYKVDGSKLWGHTATATNVDTVVLYLSEIPNLKAQSVTRIDSNIVIEGYPTEVTGSIDQFPWSFLTTDELVYFAFPKGHLKFIDDARKALDGVKIIYELAKPIKRQPLEGSLASYADGDVFLTSDSGFLPEVKFTTPVNQGAVLTDVAQKANANSQFVKRMTGVEVPPKTLTENNPTVSIDLNNSGVEPIFRGSGRTVTNQFYKRANELYIGTCNADELSGKYGDEFLIRSTATETDLEHYIDLQYCHAEPNKYYALIADLRALSNGIGLVIYKYGKNQFAERKGRIINNDSVYKTMAMKVAFDDDIRSKNPVIIRGQAFSNDKDYEFTEADFGGYIKNIRFVEISKDDYDSKSEDELAKKYPFVRGVKGLSDLAVDITGENLFDVKTTHIISNNNSYEKLYDSNGIKLDVKARYHSLYIPIDVAKNQDISFYFKLSQNQEHGQIDVYDEFNRNFIGGISSSGQTINSGNNSTVWMRFYNNYDGANVITWDNITIVEGKTLPTQYIEPYKQLIFTNSDEHFTENDSFQIKNGKMVVERKMINPIVLDGQVGVWSCSNDAAGFKVVQLPLQEPPKTNSGIVTKYNGKILTKKLQYTLVDSDDAQIVLDSSDIRPNTLLVSIRDVDSGWGEDYRPTSDEIKAYFNGWVMCGPSLSIHSEGDDKYWYKRYQGIGTFSETEFGILVENDTTQTVCPKEKAYGDITQCYTLQYELAEPEAYEVDLWGTPMLPGGKCHVTMLSGIRKEKANPVEYTAGSVYRINNRYASSLQNNTSLLSKTAYKITKIYRILNGEFYDDTDNWKILFNDTDNNNANGSAWAQIDSTMYKMRENEGINDYYVIYQTLPQENNAGLFTAELTYTDDAQSVVNELGKTLANTENELEIAKAQLKTLTEVETYEPTLLNGWKAFDETSTVQVTRKGQSVQIRGLIKSGSTNTAAFTLPEGCEPKETIRTLVPAMATITTFERLDIESSGSVKVHLQGNDPTWVSVDVDFEVGV